MIRTPLALIPYLFLFALLLGGWISYQADQVAGETQIVQADAIGGPFTLTDQNGKARTEKDFRGRYMLVYFGYTYCPDVCPTTLTVVAEALNKLGPLAERLVPVFVTVDPARDTPAVLKSYLADFDSRLVGLTGSKDAIEKITREYHVYYKDQKLTGGYAVDHSNTLYLMGPDGRFVTYYDESAGPEKIAANLRKRL
jgi:protein SCO1/2